MPHIATNRKKRTDRNHLIYLLTNVKSGEQYVGITVKGNRTAKVALQDRWNKHVHRAMCHGKNWKLCKSIRKYGAENFSKEIIDIVRGKAAAHQREVELKKTLNTVLNTA